MKPRIIPFEFGHLKGLQAREFESRELDLLDNLEGRTRDYLSRGMGYTCFIGSQVLVIAGMFIQWRGLAEVWSITTPLVTAYPLAFHRAISHGLKVMAQSMGIRRIQVAIHADHQVSHRWIQRLGFKWEGAMPGYGPDGATYVRFARLVKPEER